MLTSILISSLGRPILFDALNSLRKTTYGHEVEVILVQDILEPTVFKLLEQFDRYIVDYSKYQRGALASWNRALKLSTGDMIFPVGDDQKFHPEWLTRALKYHAEHLGGYGMVAMNDLNFDGEKQLGTTVMYDRQFCKDVLGGVAAFPVYNYFYIDNELNERAKKVGKYGWCKDAVVEHIHWSNGKRPSDIIDQSRNSSNYMELDRAIFEQRKAQGFPNNFEPVI